jgi:hypothetical protein
MTYKGLCASVSSDVDLQMCLLVEALVAVRHVAKITLPGLWSYFWLLNLYMSVCGDDARVFSISTYLGRFGFQ